MMSVFTYLAVCIALAASSGAVSALAASCARAGRKDAAFRAFCGFSAGFALWACAAAGCAAAFAGGLSQSAVQGVRAGGVLFLLYAATVAMRRGWRRIKGGPDVPAPVLAAAKMAAEAAGADTGADRAANEYFQADVPSMDCDRPFLRGLRTAAEFPQALLAVLSFLPSLAAEHSGTCPAFLALAAEGAFWAVAAAVFAIVAFSLRRLRTCKPGETRFAPAIEITAGAVLLGVAFALAAAAPRPMRQARGACPADSGFIYRQMLLVRNADAPAGLNPVFSR